MDNRFLPEPALMLGRTSQARRRDEAHARARARARYGEDCLTGPMWIDGAGLVRQMSSAQRVLVVLVENGGIDLGIPELADKLLSVLPDAVVGDDLRRSLVAFLRDTIKRLTDDLLESADLAVNHFSAAAPATYGLVTVLRNGTATHDELRDTLWKHTREGRLIDLLILTHGSDREIAVQGGVDDDKIRRMRADLGRPLAIRSVYMMNCVGASLNPAWIDAGAKVSCGSIRNNYLPEPTMHFFWQAWKEGAGFEAAATGAYRKTVNLLNDALRAFASGLAGPLGNLVARQIDFENMDFVRDSAPVVQGQRSVTVASDELSFGSSLASSLATTVLPVQLLAALGRTGGAGGRGPWSGSMDRQVSFEPEVITVSPQRRAALLSGAGWKKVDVTVTLKNFLGQPMGGHQAFVEFRAPGVAAATESAAVSGGAAMWSGLWLKPQGTVRVLAVSTGTPDVVPDGVEQYTLPATGPLRLEAVQEGTEVQVTAGSSQEAAEKAGVTGKAGVNFEVVELGGEVSAEKENKKGSSRSITWKVILPTATFRLRQL